jgi:hypothetical protein
MSEDCRRRGSKALMPPLGAEYSPGWPGTPSVFTSGSACQGVGRDLNDGTMISILDHTHGMSKGSRPR